MTTKRLFLGIAALAAAVCFTGCKDDSEDDLLNIGQSDVTGIYINEVCSSGVDWVEIYNSTDKEVSLAGFHLQDDKGAAEEYKFPEDVKIAAKGFIVLEKESHFAFGISSGGDMITLLDADGNKIDETEVPAMTDGQTYARTTDGGSEWAIMPYGTKGTSNSEVVETAAKVILNEVCGLQEPDDDWIELYNPGNADADLTGWKIVKTDEKGKDKDIYVFADGAKLKKGEYLVLATLSGELQAGISNTKQVTLTIVDANGKTVDKFDRDTDAGKDQGHDLGGSYARIPNVTGAWTIVTTSTRGAANTAGSGTAQQLKGIVVINEVYTFSNQSEVSDLDYIELYNTSNKEVSVGGLRLWEGGGEAEAWTIPAGKKIAAKGYLVIECDKYALHNDPVNYPSWGLSKNEETIVLADANGIIDQIVTPNMSTNEAYGRKTDGGSEWVIFAELTRGKTNNGAKIKETVAATAGVCVNEVFTNNQDAKTQAWDDTKDFVELYNSTDKDIDLGGYSLNDDALKEDKRYTIPAGTKIKAKSFLTLDVYKGNTAGPTFGLGKGGDKVFLYDATGKVIDEVVTPEFADTDIHSCGRKTDGGSKWVVFTEVSKNASNNGKKTK